MYQALFPISLLTKYVHTSTHTTAVLTVCTAVKFLVHSIHSSPRTYVNKSDIMARILCHSVHNIAGKMKGKNDFMNVYDTVIREAKYRFSDVKVILRWLP